MLADIDNFDIRILEILQTDASTSMDDLADHVNLSRNACWRRVKRLEQDGVIRVRVALLDPDALDCALTAIVMLKASAHAADWIARFNRAVAALPQIVSAHRMAGDIDYVLKIRVADMSEYDTFYKELTARVPLSDISASFVMEDIKDTTALPLPASSR